MDGGDHVEEDEQAEEAEEDAERDDLLRPRGRPWGRAVGREAASSSRASVKDELREAVDQQYTCADAVDQDDDAGDDDDEFAEPDPVALAGMVETYRSWASDGVVDGSTDRLVQSLYSQLAAGQARPSPRPASAGPQKRGTKRRGGRIVQMRRLKTLLEDIGVE